MHTKKFFVLILIGACLLGNSLGLAQTEAEVVVPEGETIKVGLATDLSAILPSAGLDVAQSAELAVQQFNEAGGIEGFEVELVIEDDLCDRVAAADVAQAFIDDGEVVAVVGHLCSGASIAASELYQEARIPMVSSSSTAAAFTAQGSDVTNRTVLNDNLQGVVGARYIATILEVEKVVVLHNNTPYGAGLAETVPATLEELGVAVSLIEGFDPESVDYEELVAKVAEEEPELIYFAGYATEAALLVEEIANAELEAVFFSTDGVFNTDFVDFSGEFGEGAYVTSFDQTGGAGKLEAFKTEYEAAYGVAPEILGPYHAQTYDATQMILEALKDVATVDDDGNLVIEREALVTAVRETRRLPSLTGVLTCDEFGDCGAGRVAVYQLQAGEWVELEVPDDLQVEK